MSDIDNILQTWRKTEIGLENFGSSILENMCKRNEEDAEIRRLTLKKLRSKGDEQLNVNNNYNFDNRGNKGSVAINAGSHGSTAVASSVSVFEEIKSAIKNNDEINSADKENALKIVEEMEQCAESGDKQTFKDKLNSLIVVLANLTTILTPYFPALTQYL